MNVSCTLKCFCSHSIYLFFSAPRLLPCFSSVCQPFLLPPLQGLFHLSYLNSLWTPNANSVSHLIRRINSISPLIAVILLHSEILLASFQGRNLFFFFTLHCPLGGPYSLHSTDHPPPEKLIEGVAVQQIDSSWRALLSVSCGWCRVTSGSKYASVRSNKQQY